MYICNDEKAKKIQGVFDLLDINEIQFVVLRNFHLIPHQVFVDKDIDLLIHPDSVNQAKKLFDKLGFTLTIDPDQSTHYLYGSHPHVWCDDLTYDIRFDVVQELSYRSINGCERVPADNALQESIFNRRKSVVKPWRYMPSKEDEFVHLACHCIFDKRHCSGAYQRRMEELLSRMDLAVCERLCWAAFGKFSMRLISTVDERKSKDLYVEYVSFCDY